jgi:hypothetical protein
MIWLVGTRQLDFVQVALSTGVEIQLVLLTSVLFFSPDLKTAARRLGEMVVVALVLGMVLMALVVPLLDQLALPTTAAYVRATIDRVTHQGLAYIGLMLAMSYVAATASGRARFWWYVNMISTMGIAFIALIFAMFIALGVQIAAREHLSLPVFALVWTICFAVIRLGLAYGVMTRLSREEMESLYAKFIAGQS